MSCVVDVFALRAARRKRRDLRDAETKALASFVEGRPDECWTWLGRIDRHGYGRLNAEGRSLSAHRYVYELRVGPIPDGLVIDHLCRNRSCVNPSHLEPVTVRENTLRGDTIAARHAAKTHCVNGHEFTPENTLIYRRDGTRRCRECSLQASRESRRNRAGRQARVASDQSTAPTPAA